MKTMIKKGSPSLLSAIAGVTVEKIDTQTVPRAEFMALVALAENVENRGLVPLQS